mgnify:CR=1 FL=1
MRRVLPYLLFVLAAAPAFAEKPVAPESIPGTQRVDAEAVVDLILTEPDLVVIDARRSEEHAKGHIQDSVSLLDTDTTPETLAEHVPTKQTPVLFYCNGERCLRSTNACRKAVGAGYKRVYWFRGGWIEWTEKELPVAR